MEPITNIIDGSRLTDKLISELLHMVHGALRRARDEGRKVTFDFQHGIDQWPKDQLVNGVYARHNGTWSFNLSIDGELTNNTLDEAPDAYS